MSTCTNTMVDNAKVDKKPENARSPADVSYSKILERCFNRRQALMMRSTPDATPVASTQIPITRLATAEDLMALYNFSFIKQTSLKAEKILITSYFNTTSVDIATWICYS